MSKINVNTVDTQCGSTLTLGSSGKTVTLASGASQSGFGRTGTVDWCTTAKTSPFTAVNGKGYFVDTSSSEITVTLPASPSAGDILAIADLKGTFDTNRVVLCRNSSKIKGACGNLQLQDERMATSIIYSGSCQGWISINNTNVTCGATIKNLTYGVQYLVVAGGGGGGATCGGMGGAAGGGAGGFRAVACKNFSVAPGTSFPITVGAGGAGGSTPPSFSSSCATGSNGTNSVFSTITSAAGGFGAFAAPSGCREGGPGGSGGGSGGGPGSSGGTGNTPPVAPPQGNDGGDNGGPARGAGGGGAAAAAGDAANPGNFTGGAGSNTTILGSIPQVPSYGEPGPNPGRYFGGGGGGGLYDTSPEQPAGNNGGIGGGGNGGSPGAGSAGTANTGGGGGGAGRSGSAPIGSRSGGAGGSGIVVIRHTTADASPSVSGGNVVATCGSDTIRIFTSDGTFTS